MKRRSLFSFLVSLAMLGTGSLPVFAQFTMQLHSGISVNLNGAEESQTKTARSQNSGRTRPVAEVFRSILPQLKRQTNVPILLPSELFGRQPGERIYVSSTGEVNGYRINLASAPNCRGANTCFVGYFGAERGGTIPSSDQVVRLAKGITGYYKPLSCGGSCSPPSISWMYQGVLYTIQMRVSRNPKEAEVTMIRLANSAIEAIA